MCATAPTTLGTAAAWPGPPRPPAYPVCYGVWGEPPAPRIVALSPSKGKLEARAYRVKMPPGIPVSTYDYYLFLNGQVVARAFVYTNMFPYVIHTFTGLKSGKTYKVYVQTEAIDLTMQCTIIGSNGKPGVAKVK